MTLPRRRRLASLAALVALIGLAGPAHAALPPSPPDPGPSIASGSSSAQRFVPGGRGAGIERRALPGSTPKPSNTATRPSTGNDAKLLPFGERSFYTQDISKAPLAHDSAALADNLRRQVVENWNGIAAVNAYSFNIPFYRATKSTPRITVGWSNCFKFDWTPADLFDGKKYFMNVPIPLDAAPAKGTDSSMSIYDPETDTSWEFWQMRKNATTGAWSACWGGRMDNVKQAQGMFPKSFGVSAAGLSLAGGAISVEEARRGKIEHAMYLATINARYFTTYSWPANRSDGFSKNPNTVMQGQRLRLDPTLNLDNYRLTKLGRAVAEAAQTYGFIVSDHAGAVAVITEDGAAEKLKTGKNPWDSLLGAPHYEVLRNFPWDKVQVLPKDYGRP